MACGLYFHGYQYWLVLTNLLKEFYIIIGKPMVEIFLHGISKIIDLSLIWIHLYALFSYDYESIEGSGPFTMMKRLEQMCTTNELINKTFSTSCGNKQYTVKLMDDFSYKDPVDGSYTEKQGIRIIFTDGSRIIFRLSGTGAHGATIRLYIDSFENNPETYTKDAQVRFF